VCCTDEVDVLYPRHEWSREQLKDDPAVRLFRDTYGRQVPEENWNPDPDMTKQGVYAMMPDGTYLSARFVGGNKEDVMGLFDEALKRWKAIVKERGLKPKPVPQTPALQNWHQQKEIELGLHLQFNYRDLPRAGQKILSNGKVIGEHHNTAWVELTKSEAKLLVPNSSTDGKWQKVPATTRDKIYLLGLKDIVYGQIDEWGADDLQKATLEKRSVAEKGAIAKMELKGTFHLKDRAREYQGKLFGTFDYNSNEQRITNFRATVIGTRTGKTTYNFRDGDPGPAPLGIALSANQK